MNVMMTRDSERMWKRAHLSSPRLGIAHTEKKKKETYLNFYFQFCVDLRLHSVPCKSGILKVLQGPTLQVGILDS